MVTREEAYASRYQEQSQGYFWGSEGNDGRWIPGRSYYPNQGWQQAPPQPPPPQPMARGLFQPWNDNNFGRQTAPRRDPDYFWGGRFN
jgi:hypothetical protein